MKGINLVALTPHPPIIIPEVGKENLKKVQKTVDAMKEVSRQVAEINPDTVVIISPHGPMFQDAVAMLDGPELEGSLFRFGAPDTKLKVNVDQELLEVLIEKAQERDINSVIIGEIEEKKHRIERKLDHGFLVPALYLKETNLKADYLHITFGLLTRVEIYAFGVALQEAALATGKKVVVIASGDMSHKLTEDAPAGYSPEGEKFDSNLVQFVKEYDLENIIEIDEKLITEAGECGYRSFLIGFGALDGYDVDVNFLSYEGTFGVGYMVAILKTKGKNNKRDFLKQVIRKKYKHINMRRKEESPAARLARASLEAYITGEEQTEASEAAQELTGKAGVFVSIKKDGQLRGCIGTTEPTASSLAEEIKQNAISAGTRDPRFSPVEPEELAQLEYSVDVLLPSEEVENLEQLDAKEYGVIVESGSKRGLLLPDLPGINTAEEQVRIAKEKAGIIPNEYVKLYRFKVKRHL